MNRDQLRAAIDQLDDRMVELLAERAAIVATLWTLKQAHGEPLRDPRREEVMRARLSAAAQARGLDATAVLRVFAAIIGEPLYPQDDTRLTDP
jgi:chorismate mutase